MKIVYNKVIPFRGFYAINLFGIIFIRSIYKDTAILCKDWHDTVINHEAIHTEQMKETLYIGFYILYLINWIVNLLINTGHAYRAIGFEREAYSNQDNTDYLKGRRHYAWIRYIFK